MTVRVAGRDGKRARNRRGRVSVGRIVSTIAAPAALDASKHSTIVARMVNGALRLEPAAELLAAVRSWLSPVRGSLGPNFLAGYVTGSALSPGFATTAGWPRSSHRDG